VKRLLALLVGGLGIRALLRRRGGPPALEAPAEELRAKLAARREPEPEPEPEPDVDSRRADVHDRARRAIDVLQE
jgi:hypothetical protein